MELAAVFAVNKAKVNELLANRAASVRAGETPGPPGTACSSGTAGAR